MHPTQTLRDHQDQTPLDRFNFLMQPGISIQHGQTVCWVHIKHRLKTQPSSQVWKPVHKNLWFCTSCPNHTPCESQQISAHEQGARHKKHLAHYDHGQQASVDSDSSSESAPVPGPSVNVQLPQNHVLGPLARTLSQMARSSATYQPVHNHAADISGVDWDAADYDTQLEGLRDIHMTTLAQNFVTYLKEGDIDHDSDDDSDERSQVNSSSDSGNGESLYFCI